MCVYFNVFKMYLIKLNKHRIERNKHKQTKIITKNHKKHERRLRQVNKHLTGGSPANNIYVPHTHTSCHIKRDVKGYCRVERVLLPLS